MAAPDPTYPKLTVAEHVKVASLVARMAKRCIASESVDRSDLERKVDRILEGARKRQEKTK
ncbi:DUF6257 family protein [Streptomyces sp. NPDC056543]|uniref:DUF6257 family protein n=1 Tax=unclassified Streptomyces TaxID=2593676 RepID=UPI00367EA474